MQGEADLVEEIARVASLTRLAGRPLARPAGVARPILTPMQRREGQARRRIAALGFNECVTYSFIDRAAAELFGGGGEAVRLENPISSEMSHLRPDLLPGLLRAAARNQARGFADLALFEIGQVFPGGEPGEQVLLATGLRVGATAPRDPHGTRRPVDLWDARADAEAALAAIGAPAALMLQRTAPGLVPPRPLRRPLARPEDAARRPSASCTRASCRPSTCAAPPSPSPCASRRCPSPRPATTTRPPLVVSDLQPVERDFAFVLDAGVEAEAVLKAARAADKALIEAVSVFDVFAGPKAEAQMGPGKKSMAIAVRLQPTTATLTDAEIEAVSRRVVEGVTQGDRRHAPRLTSEVPGARRRGARQSQRYLPTLWAAIVASICAFTASMLKLAPFCIGGKSMKLCAALPTSCCTSTKRQNSVANQL